MEDKDKTKEKLIVELSKLRQRVLELENSKCKSKDERGGLCASDECFKIMFQDAPSGAALINSLNGKIYEVNLRYAEICGRTVEELLSMDWMSIPHPGDVQGDLDNITLLNAKKISRFNMRKRYIRPDGSYVWINMTISPIKVADKTKPRHLCMVEDITERKKIEKNLIESEEKYKLLAEKTSDLVCLTSFDLKCTLLYVSPSYKRVLGYAPEELLGTSGLDFIHPEDKNKLIPLLKDYLVQKTKKIFTGKEEQIMEKIEYRLPDKSGKWHDMAVTADAVGDKILFFMKDITERKKMESDLKEKVEELSTMNQMMVGRELKMIELKEEIKRLSDELKKLRVRSNP